MKKYISLSQFQKGFSEYIAGEYKSLIASSAPVHTFSQTQTNDDPGPRFVHSIRYRFYEKYRKKLTPAKTHFLLIDAMRWDIWDYCRHDFPEEDGIFTCKYNFIDDKLHTSGEDLLTIFSEIKLNLQSSLAEYMNKLPVKSMVIFRYYISHCSAGL